MRLRAAALVLAVAACDPPILVVAPPPTTSRDAGVPVSETCATPIFEPLVTGADVRTLLPHRGAWFAIPTSGRDWYYVASTATAAAVFLDPIPDLPDDLEIFAAHPTAGDRAWITGRVGGDQGRLIEVDLETRTVIRTVDTGDDVLRDITGPEDGSEVFGAGHPEHGGAALWFDGARVRRSENAPHSSIIGHEHTAAVYAGDTAYLLPPSQDCSTVCVLTWHRGLDYVVALSVFSGSVIRTLAVVDGVVLAGTERGLVIDAMTEMAERTQIGRTGAEGEVACDGEAFNDETIQAIAPAGARGRVYLNCEWFAEWSPFLEHSCERVEIGADLHVSSVHRVVAVDASTHLVAGNGGVARMRLTRP